MSFQTDVYNRMKELVAIPSLSGTRQESFMADKIYEELFEIPYFKENSHNIGRENIPDDPLRRSFIWAVVNGKENSPNSLILSGHLDVVGVEEFGHLKSIAFDVEKCTERISELELDKDAAEDAKSGDWIFGRGTADMKFGLALNMELIKEFSVNRNFRGNLILLIVPGEESNSEGMLAALPFLLKLKKNRKYEYCGMVISEPSIPEKSEKISKRLYIGSVGKIMPLFFCVGKETHVGDSLNGINPNLMVSEINRLLECSEKFSDAAYGEITPPPMCLKQMDLKELYSVQSPLYAAAYYNVLTLKMGYEEFIESMKDLAVEAFSNALDNLLRKKEGFSEKSSRKIEIKSIHPCVMTYSEILSEVKDKHEDFSNHMRKKIQIWKNEKKDNQTIAVNIVRETYELYEEKKPMIIISIIPPYYPHKYLESKNYNSSRFMNAVEDTLEYAEKKLQEKIIKTNFFMGISDASYTGISADDISIDKLLSDMVGYDMIYRLPINELKNFDIPVIIFGGSGKDLHKYTERLNLPYSLNVVPKLYRHLILDVLK
ncbi:M20/M25/M40 family metallo-hydrolase [Clostridium luticellarii]|jgi:arginine utilization protein RocB|uniref:Succinyl-diaminopimelate desuccinylase n=1 Tax=Clostridium luticellarii TaxID=1691940 RepID=A0A2T0BMB1_9CLOT|nr:M20/M25/M40 family metallo-hydrolase [Clostridium luticellarii]MCI1945205.1 M20/M25/M40 family metallo-hydrolase [Clostridium luticellarii]MCI1968833.1 M20/M25/M40 family metallo-hydrolase [Clostridium luticellarii]MCI1995619.1 M20/M25/M40 family metallo-hydrolase [Clostridium luticellarii]MCI2040007.1 M20/M25/M40 family metallo-hydrolase [Clostridium luticellarii]PRR85014.1 succinyl-diaminopimelate desuccinylase [Clostridium luticellarii]